MMAAFSQGWLQGCEGGCETGVPRPVLHSRVPAPRGCLLGQGLCLLPGSALSLPGEINMVLWGEDAGGRIDPNQGRVLQLWRGCCMGQGCSQSQLMPRSAQGIPAGVCAFLNLCFYLSLAQLGDNGNPAVQGRAGAESLQPSH